MEYPAEVIAVDKKGNKEARILVDKGSYVRYQYADPKTGKIVKKGKCSIILKNNQGKQEHLFLIPLKGDKSLVVKQKSEESNKKIWSEKEKKAIDPS
jgi:hypothetical protein